MYVYKATVRLYDTDAAGLLFFGNHFRIAHAAYEEFLDSMGVDIGGVIREGKHLIPIVHAEADYKAALGVGDKLTVHLTCETISEHSFVLSFVFLKDGVGEVARVRTAHVMIDASTHEKKPLPANLIAVLEGLG
jgi:1,4-dihydroxy-2-naphthoyl-CoA hydrolase